MAAERRRSAAPPDMVAPLTRAHVPAAARVVATALADDPGYRYLLPDESRRVGELTALYRMTLADTLAHGRGFVTTLGPVVTAALAIYPPGTYPMTPARWARAGGRVALLAARAREHSPGFVRFGQLTAPAVPTHAWYVEAVGVRPDLQLVGRGTALVEATNSGLIQFSNSSIIVPSGSVPSVLLADGAGSRIIAANSFTLQIGSPTRAVGMGNVAAKAQNGGTIEIPDGGTITFRGGGGNSGLLATGAGSSITAGT